MSKKEKSDSAENIRVVVRCRPLNGKEKDSGYKSCVDLNVAESTVTVNHVMGQPDRWTFDGVVNNTFSQKDIFTQFIVPMIDNVMDGFNATVFAYGQSGSGKTHTMTGKPDSEELMGIIPRTFDHIFEQARLAQELHPGRKYSMSCSYVELYNGKVRDLLAKKQETLEVKENKDKTFYVKGVTQPQVKYAAELRNIVDEGTDRRQVSATELNADSSRSHSIFTLVVEMLETSEDGDARSVTSKFNLVDLAGSERQSKTGAQGDTLKEGCNINLSLSALGTVIDCLVKAKPHVPFRSSPLTMLLKDSLGGSSKTCMFANVGPSEHNVAETVSTLRFADRAKQIKNKPVVNMDTKDQKIAELTAQVAELKDKLKQFEGDGLKQLEDEVEKLRERVGELEVDLDNATKSRDADRSEFNEVTHSKTAELEALQQQAAEQKVTLAALQSEMDLAVQQARDQKRDTAELWRVLHAEVGPGFAKPDVDPADEDGDVDMLTARLQELKGNVPREQFENAEAALRAMAAAREDEKIAHDAAIADFQGQIQTTKEELDATQKQVERLKEKAGRHESSPSKAGGAGGLDATAASVGDSVAAAAELAKRDAEIDRLRAAVSNNAETKAADAEIARSRQAHASEVATLKAEVDAMRAAVAAGLGSADPASAAGQMRQVFDAQTEALAAARAQLATLEAEHLKLLQARGALPAGAAQGAIARLGEQRESERKDLGAVVAQRNALLLDAARSAQPDVQQHASEVVKENTVLRAASTSRAKAADTAQLAGVGDADLRAENRRLQELLDAQRGSKRAAVAAARASSQQGTQAASDLARFIADRKAASGADDPVAAAVEALLRDRETLESEVTRQAAELQALGTSGAAAGEARHGSGRFNVSALDPDELRDEVLDLQSDLAKVKALRETAAKEKAEAAQEVVEMKQALAGVSRDFAAAQEKIKAMEAEREAARDTVAQQFTSKVAKLEARLKERTEQQQEMRKLVETQKVVADALKGKMEALTAQLAQSQVEMAEKDRKLAAARDTQDASFQKLLSRRLEEHRKALLRREDDHGALRKKLKKAEAKVEKMKEKFDEKVYEYEELASRMEEQKLEYMKSLVGKEVVVVEEAKAQVRDALRAAKEDRQRQLDAFNNGTIGGARAAAAGSAAQAAARLRSAIGPTTPPAEEVVVVPSHIGGRPPPGYTQGKAVAAAAGGMGGAGYSSAPIARPPTGANGQGFRRPPSARGGVSNDDDDMYNF